MDKDELRPVKFMVRTFDDGNIVYEDVNGWFHAYGVSDGNTYAIIEKQDGMMEEVGIHNFNFLDR